MQRRINRPVSVWLAFPTADAQTLSGVLSFSSPTEGLRFHSYGELMALLHRLATTAADETAPAASMLKLAS